MRIDQAIHEHGRWRPGTAPGPVSAGLVLAFAPPSVLLERATWDALRDRYPDARIVGCSTAGEIVDTTVLDDCVACTGVEFERSHAEVACVRVDDPSSADALGRRLAAALPADGLRHVLVFSDGLHVNGTALVAGMVTALPPGVAITGGLAGDGWLFERTAVCLDAPAQHAQVVAVGLYGPQLEIRWGCHGGWDPFGVERVITRAEGRVVYELDGEPALDLYRRYLGDAAADLPASALRFPLAIRPADGTSSPLVRTVLSIDERGRSLTFAGDMPVGYRARLMKSNVERLIDGAHDAGREAVAHGAARPAELALIVSCVGRRLVMKQRIEEEVEAVRDALGAGTALAGFYSYGELAPSGRGSRCDLHNETLAITTIAEH
jgi:hypothetical protein